MVNQGLWGALEQFWTVEEKPRLHRRNTFFEEYQVTQYDALKLGIVATTLTITIIVTSMIGGVLL